MKRLLTYWLLLCACVIAQPELTNTEATNIDTPAERQAWREALELWTDDSPTFLDGTYTGDLSVGSKLTVGNGALDDTHIVNIVSAEDVITEVMLHLEWNSPTPAAGDSNALLFSMYDSALNETEYARFRSVIEDPTDGTEDGAMTVDVLNNGVLEQAVLFSHDEIIMNDNGADRNFIVKDNTTAEVLRITGGTGSIAMDGSTLFVDSANNRVGVGTNTPNEALEVVGTILVNSGSWTGSTFTGTQSFASGARVVGELYSFVGSELAGNQVLGKGALSSFLGGARNTAIGYNAGYTSTIISDSTYVGHQTTGSHNGITVLGSSASATGLNAIAIGRQASAGANELVIGTDANIASGTIWGTIDFPDSITTSGTNILSATDFTGQVEMTGQAASTDDSAMTRSLSDARYLRKFAQMTDAQKSFTSDTTLATLCSVTIPETGWYFINAYTEADGTNAKGQITVTSGVAYFNPAFAGYREGRNSGGSPVQINNLSGAVSGNQMISFKGAINVTVAPCVIALQAAQNASNATPTVFHRGSYIMMEEMPTVTP